MLLEQQRNIESGLNEREWIVAQLKIKVMNINERIVAQLKMKVMNISERIVAQLKVEVENNYPPKQSKHTPKHINNSYNKYM